MQEPCQQEKEKRERWETAIYMNGFRDGINFMRRASKSHSPEKQLIEAYEEDFDSIVQIMFEECGVSRDELISALHYLEEFHNNKMKINVRV